MNANTFSCFFSQKFLVCQKNLLGTRYLEYQLGVWNHNPIFFFKLTKIEGFLVRYACKIFLVTQ